MYFYFKIAFILVLFLCAVIDYKEQKLKRILYLVPVMLALIQIMYDFLNENGQLFFFGLAGGILSIAFCIAGNKIKAFGTADYPFIIGLFVLFTPIPASIILLFSVIIPLISNEKKAYLPFLSISFIIFLIFTLIIKITSMEFLYNYLHLL